jgi:hypothetical protein
MFVEAMAVKVCGLRAVTNLNDGRSQIAHIVALSMCVHIERYASIDINCDLCWYGVHSVEREGQGCIEVRRNLHTKIGIPKHSGDRVTRRLQVCRRHPWHVWMHYCDQFKDHTLAVEDVEYLVKRNAAEFEWSQDEHPAQIDSEKPIYSTFWCDSPGR